MKINVKILSLLLGGGVLLGIIPSVVVNATTTNRAQNIKSHGIFIGKNAEATQEVLLDSADLKYLASEIDSLDGMIAAYQQRPNANIEYEYHYHAGNNASKGGCYTVPVYHQHSGSSTYGGGCYITPVYHQHSGSSVYGGGCYTVVNQGHVYKTGDSWGDGTYSFTFYCDNCGRVVGSEGHWMTDGLENGDRGDETTESGITEEGTVHYCGGYSLGCGKDGLVDHYSLGCGLAGTIDHWALGCNRHNGEIVSATIKFAPGY